MLQHTAYRDTFGVDSFACAAVTCGESDFAACKRACEVLLEQEAHKLAARRRNPHYRALKKLQNAIYAKPEMTFDQENVYALYHGSKGYLRQIYRQCYGLTLHEDCTCARIARGQYLLTVTLLSLSEIAEQCGYSDAKYFMRQFQQHTGMTAMQYRSMTS